MTITVSKRRLFLLALAVAIAWPGSLWAVGYNAAQFVRDSNVRSCKFRGTPQLVINSHAWRTAATVRMATDTPGSMPAGWMYGESSDALRQLAAIPCEKLFPKPPLLPMLSRDTALRPPVRIPRAITPTATPR